jgi:hypothetical protein
MLPIWQQLIQTGIKVVIDKNVGFWIICTFCGNYCTANMILTAFYKATEEFTDVETAFLFEKSLMIT